MSLSKRLLGWGLGAAGLGGLVLLAYQSVLVLPYLNQLETKEGLERAVQARSLFFAEAEDLARTVEDWSYWEQAVSFVQGRNPTFEAENLYADAYQSIRVDAMVFFGSDRTVYWAKQRSPSGAALEPVTDVEVYRQALVSLTAEQSAAGVQGYLQTPHRLVFAALRQVRTSAHGLVPGYLVMVRNMDSEFWTSFVGHIGNTITPQLHNSGAPTTVSLLRSGDQTLVRIPVADLTGRFALELELLNPRNYERTGTSVLTQIAWGSILILLLTTIGNAAVVRRYLVRPVKDLWRLTRQLELTGDWSLRAQSRSKDEIGELAQGVNGLISAVQERTRRLEGLATSDALTNLANRRAFDAALVEAWKTCRRERQPMGFILCDVDYFKRYNDRYGHQLGDVCLKAVASVIQDTARRPGDITARYGGEEFALVLPRTDLAGTQLVAERVRTALMALEIPHEDNPHGVVTISLGCESVIPSRDGTPDVVVQAADRHLYQAKSDGRNRVRSESAYSSF